MHTLVSVLWCNLLVWPRKYAYSSFSSLVQYLLPKDTLLSAYLLPQKQCSVININGGTILINITCNVVIGQTDGSDYFTEIATLMNYRLFTSTTC